MKMLSALLGAALLTAPAVQAQQPWMQIDQVIEIEVLPGWRDGTGDHVAGLLVRLAPGWVTYWRTAGAAGISPQMDWARSQNVRAVVPVWPTPKAFSSFAGQSIGYDSDFVLPLRIETGGDGPVRLEGELNIGVCKDICLPAQLSVSAELPEDGTPDPAIQAALADQPSRMDVQVTCRVRRTTDGLALAGEIYLPALGPREAVVFEVPDPSIWVTDALVSRDGDWLTATSELMVAGDRRLEVDRSLVRITVISDSEAVEIVGCSE